MSTSQIISELSRIKFRIIWIEVISVIGVKGPIVASSSTTHKELINVVISKVQEVVTNEHRIRENELKKAEIEIIKLTMY